LLDLPLQRLDVARVAVSDAADADARHEVDVFVAVSSMRVHPVPRAIASPE